MLGQSYKQSIYGESTIIYAMDFIWGSSICSTSTLFNTYIIISGTKFLNSSNILFGGNKFKELDIIMFQLKFGILIFFVDIFIYRCRIIIIIWQMLTCALRAYAKEFKIEIIILKIVYSTLFNFLESKF